MSPPIPSKTKRQQLGELLAWLRSEQSMSTHNVADKTKVTTKDVSRWERGDLVSTSQEWNILGAVFPQLRGGVGNRHRELYDGAAAEQRAIEQARNAEPEPVRQPRPEPTQGADIDAAVRMLIEAIPSLRALNIEINEAGEATVNYRIREIRVVEDSGTMNVRTR